ncbi:hypothetical protein QQS21_008760 [Conoideocrella luteorostrata]|uniref:Uncharacterized protein n=1 Tax=Conoideocrella luteorostrata TaxID=1105319 RepID=A0AAJ0CJ48_9HYPO|nr:hypothetical protein QQS21_008760 [Conoideocrella luteorostrata]
MAAPNVPEHRHNPLATGLHAHGQFKKHKVLPRPRNNRSVGDTRSIPATSDLAVDTSVRPPGSSGSQSSSPRTLKHQPRRIGTGPDLPPTPPNYSRTSSGSHPAQPSSPGPHDGVAQTPQAAIARRPPATPPDQRSPPTPDVTPPQPANRPRALRPLALERGHIRTVTATTDSRTESFKTAREDQLSSEDEAATSTAKTVLASSTPSQTTVLRAPVGAASRAVQPETLDLAFERLNTNPDESYTPRTRGELAKFDGEWDSPRYVEREWDDNLQRMVSVGRLEPKEVTPRTPQLNGTKDVVALEDKLVTPTNAAKAVRSMSLKETAPPIKSSPKSSPQATPQRRRTALGTPRLETSKPMEPRRYSGLSNQSTPSTVIEAMLFDSPSPLQKQRTLRHIRKRRVLREPSSGGREYVTEESETPQVNYASHPPPNTRTENARRHDSYTSTTSTNSIASGRARREIWKNGGIPVVIVPDRRSSSHKSKSREPSLRSTSSRHSKRTRSVGSSPSGRSPPQSEELSFDRQSRWDRSTSISDGSDQRTLDFLPTLPARSSSLSAPTSHTTSRTGSLTTESINAMNDLHSQSGKKLLPSQMTPPTLIEPTTSAVATHAKPSSTPAPPIPASPIISMHNPPQTPRSDREHGHDSLGVDHHDDAASARKYSSRTTPFSVLSMETNWTAPEVSEAQAIHMYPHQNSSVLMVNHSTKPSETSDVTEKDLEQRDSNEPPRITATSPEGGLMTPDQRRSLEEVDSPLRNPRSAPDPPSHPPAINFIPATPSGLTPAEEKAAQLGNFYEAAAVDKPDRRPSLVRRALSRRRHSISYPPPAAKQPGFLTRTFSLSRNDRRSYDFDRPKFLNPDMDPTYGEKEDRPAEEDKLHPHWRPQWENDDYDDCDCPSCRHGRGGDEAVYRYPLVDNRPRPLKRSLSAKVKQTFAILPARGEYQYYVGEGDGPERRTIRRTPSGNLKVMRRRPSVDSLRNGAKRGDEPRPVSESNSQKAFWRGHSLRRRRSSERLRRSSSLSSHLERLPSLTRKWSEKRREKRTQELRQMISGPQEVRDGVGNVTRMSATKGQQNGKSYRI